VHHIMLDQFAAQQTPVRRLDPVAKTVAAIVFILAAVLVRKDHLLPFTLLAAALAVYHAVGKVPLLYTLKRVLMVSPFALAIVVLFPFLEPGRAVWTLRLGPWAASVSDAGLQRAGHLGCTFALCAVTTLLLLATTPFQEVLSALARLRVPRAFVIQLAFLYRYLWVLLDELMRMRRARAARDGGLGPWSLRFRSHAGVVGVLFLRTYDRAERIYWAMAARGFDGRLPAPPTQRMTSKDAVFLCGVAALAAATLTLDRLAYG